MEGAKIGLGLGMVPNLRSERTFYPAGSWGWALAGAGTQGWSVTVSKAVMMEERSGGEQQLLAGRAGSCWGQAGCQDRGKQRGNCLCRELWWCSGIQHLWEPSL